MITYGKQSISKADIRAVKKVLLSDWLTLGPEVTKFESKLSEKIDAECFVVSSGTAALHCAYAAIELVEGDEIITPPLTFIATQSTAMLFGAKIIFCDVDAESGLMDIKKIESLITSRTKAITIVDYAGQPGPMKELRALADRHHLYLIEDAAHSLGSTYHGKPVGSLADLTTFSFFPTKNITTAEGGAVSSNDRQLLDKARKFGRQGMIKEPDRFQNEPDGRWHQEVHRLGVNYRLPDLLAALGHSQLRRLESFKKKRSQVFDFYVRELGDLSEIKLPKQQLGTSVNWHLFPLRVPSALRNNLFEELWSNEIYVQVNYVPAYFHPVFKSLGYQKGLCPEAEKFYSEEISLPMYPDLSRREMEKVVRVIRNFFNKTHQGNLGTE